MCCDNEFCDGCFKCFSDLFKVVEVWIGFIGFN